MLLCQAHVQFAIRVVEGRVRDDLDGLPTEPSARCRGRDAAARSVRNVPRALHELDEAVIVDLLAALS